MSKEATMITFVDDSNTTIKEKNNADLIDTMKANLKESEEYTSQNELALNAKKTKIFSISKENTIAKNLSLPSDDPLKPIVDSQIINMLGITIEKNLKMNYHISQGKTSLLNQLSFRLNILRKLVKVSDFHFSKQLANSLFHSKLLYGIEVWGLAPLYLINKIQVLQNKAARIVQGFKSRNLDTNTLISNMNWMKVRELIHFRISCLIHKIIHQKKPLYLYEILVTNNSTNTRNNIGHKLGTKPSNIGSSQFTKNQFCSRAYEIYNILPATITSIVDQHIFKLHLKKYFLNNDNVPDPQVYKIAGLMDGL